MDRYVHVTRVNGQLGRHRAIHLKLDFVALALVVRLLSQVP